MILKATLLPITLLAILMGCESIDYVTSEIKGTAKPEGGIEENIPVEMKFQASKSQLLKAVRQVVENQGFIYDYNPSTGTLRTEPKQLPREAGFRMMAATYSVKLFITVQNEAVSYRAKFDKRSNVTMAENNLDIPTKENELRKEFFSVLQNYVTPKKTNTNSNTIDANSSQDLRTSSLTRRQVRRAQEILNALNYPVGVADGFVGPRTTSAVVQFQTDEQLPAQGNLNEETLSQLEMASSRIDMPPSIQGGVEELHSDSGSSAVTHAVSRSVLVRERANPFSKTVGKLNPGEKVVLIGSSGGWSEIKMGNLRGFVESDVLAEI